MTSSLQWYLSWLYVFNTFWYGRESEKYNYIYKWKFFPLLFLNAAYEYVNVEKLNSPLTSSRNDIQCLSYAAKRFLTSDFRWHVWPVFIVTLSINMSLCLFLDICVRSSKRPVLNLGWIYIFSDYITNVQEMNRSIEQHGWQISRGIVYVSIIYMQLKPDVQIMSNNCSWSNGREREYVTLQSLIIKFTHCLLKLENW